MVEIFCMNPVSCFLYHRHIVYKPDFVATQVYLQQPEHLKVAWKSAELFKVHAPSTLVRFLKYTKMYAFSLSSKTLRSIAPYTTVLMRFQPSTVKRSKTIESHVVT